MAVASARPEGSIMKEKPPSDSIERTTELMRRLVAVPKHELEAQERKWRRRRRARPADNTKSKD
jgi:hypothetical protein